MKDSFILYTEQKEVIDKLTDEQAGKLIKAIYSYAKDGEMPQLDAVLDLVVTPFKTALDRNEAKWQETKKKRSEAGKLGAKIKQNKAKQANAKFAKQSEAMLNNAKQNKQKEANQAVSVNVSVSDSVSGSVNNNSVINIAPVADAYEKNIGLVTPHIAELLQDYLQELPEDLIVLAIQKADEAGNRNFKYVKGILDNWLKSGVKTLQDVKKQDEEFKNRKVLKNNAGKDNKKAPCAKGISPYEQRTYENLDFLYANKTKKESDTDDNDSNSTNEL